MLNWQTPQGSNKNDYPLKARELVRETLHDQAPDQHHHLDDIYVVWFCYIIGGWKALVGYQHDGLYYEVTHDVAKQQTYVDIYAKEFQRVFKTDV